MLSSATVRDVIHAAGLTGAGIKIGVLSTSIGPTAGPILNGELPADTKVLSDLGGNNDTKEGLQMAEVVHGVAPGASIDYATGDFTEPAMADSIRALAADGCQVIVDDIWWPNEDTVSSPVSLAIDAVTAAGVAYFTAAGNTGSTVIPGHESDPRANPVGAYSVSTSAVESYSSPNPNLRFLAPDGVTTGVYINGNYEFYGSSCSVAVAGAAAALMLQAVPTLTPGALAAALQATATPVAGSTAGLVDVAAAVASVQVVAPVVTPVVTLPVVTPPVVIVPGGYNGPVGDHFPAVHVPWWRACHSVCVLNGVQF